VLLDVNRKQPEREPQPDGAQGWRKLRLSSRPTECAQGIFERIDDEVQYEADDLTVEQQSDLLEVLNEGLRFQRRKRNCKTTRV